jgi:NAD(P)-dependent dehydrogenase (short-subunit alcohol dehydrogenase family)
VSKRNQLHFDAATEIPSLAGKTILVTGGTAGLGRETVLAFAKHEPARIYFTGRSQSSADSLVAEAKTSNPNTPLTFIQCDLASLTSVQQAARTIVDWTDRLDIAMLNAGIMAVGVLDAQMQRRLIYQSVQVPGGLTKDGYEIQFVSATLRMNAKLRMNLTLRCCRVPITSAMLFW